MANYFGAIDSYTVNVLSPQNFSNRRLMLLFGSFGIAKLWFYADDATLPDNSKTSGQDRFTAYFPASYWQPILDVLRNESPVYFNFFEPNGVQIYTGSEPVGEEEAN